VLIFGDQDKRLFLLIFFKETAIHSFFFQNYLMNRKFKVNIYIYIYICMYVFTVTFDQFNVSLLNKSINSIQIIVMTSNF